MTTFSIFLPVRNGWPYVQECVESILQQTYPHFTLHVLDNQSKDNTVPWLESLKDPRLRLSKSVSSLSIEESWARVRGLPKDEFMTVIGHDDLLDRHFLATTKALIDRHPKASLYQTGSRFINAEGKVIRSTRPAPERESAAEYLAARFKFERDAFGTGFVMRSTDYDRVGGIPSFEKLFFADDALWLALTQKSYKATDPHECFSVRIHPKSESASLPSVWSSMLLSLNQFTEFLHRFAEEDEACASVLETLGPSFLLTYHRNIYIYALVEACQKHKKCEPATLHAIQSSLAKTAPTVADRLAHSLRVGFLELLNASPVRSQVVRLWNAYYLLKTR